MLKFTGSQENNGCFKLLGLTTKPHETNLITENVSLLTNNYTSSGECMDTCSFYSGPSDDVIMAYGDSDESCGAIAYSNSESCGSVAYSSAGTVSTAVSVSSSSSCSCACSYSC